MEFKSVVKKRGSVRKYDLSKTVSVEVVNRVLEAARLAPSACNLQPWHFIVIRDAKKKEAMKEVYAREWFYTAPVVIVGCVDTSVSWKRPADKFVAALVDLAIAFEHLVLAAADESLGTCWVCNFNNETARHILKVPENIQIAAMTPLGYPAEETQARPRKTLKEIIHEDTW